MVAGVLRGAAGGLFALLAFRRVIARGAGARTRAAFHRHDPQMDQRLPPSGRSRTGFRCSCTRSASMQAFKDSETCGAYIGFIAGVLGSNPARAKSLVAKMLPIAPADRWVLVRAIAYSGLANWKELLISFADRMPEWRAMINRYLEGKLPTLDQIAYPVGEARHVRQDQDRAQNRRQQRNAVALEPSPELIDVLWGYYLATGAYKPIGQIIKLLPLADDKESVDNLTTGSAAKFTLASNAVRDLKSSDHAQMVGSSTSRKRPPRCSTK